MIEKRYSRRRLLKQSAIVISGTLLTACSPDPTNSRTDKSSSSPTPSLTANTSGYPVQPYISKAEHLDTLPWPKQSFYKQPWRSYLETVPAAQFLDGLGINYNLPPSTNDLAVVRLLAESGFRTIRLEINWGNVAWNEDNLTNNVRLKSILEACRQFKLLPLILLNANQGAPCPNLATLHKLLNNAKQGTRQLKLDTVANLKEGYSGLTLSSSWMAELIFTRIDTVNSTVELSKALPKDLDAGQPLNIHTLKYLPLYPTGKPEFEATATGWLKYLDLILQLLNQIGLDEVEFEIWNELTFGSQFLSINNYYATPIAEFKVDFLDPAGGQGWELARRTKELLKKRKPPTKVIWGFSNTAFHQTPIATLPPGIDGQSYHPYGTARQIIPKDFPFKYDYDQIVENFVPPNLVLCMPEGWAHLGVQTAQLMRLLNSEVRKTNRPANTTNFYHYITEHGFNPAQIGLTAKKDALDFKAKALIRSMLFWLNKGIQRMYIYSAYDSYDRGSGLLLAEPSPKDYPGQPAEQLYSPALKALKNVVARFENAQPLPTIRPLTVEVVALGAQSKVFEGDSKNPPLYNREMITFLPFQINPKKWLCAIYLMCYDITNPPPPMAVELKIKGLGATTAQAIYYDPLSDKNLPLNFQVYDANSLKVNLEIAEYPKLLIVEE